MVSEVNIMVLDILEKCLVSRLKFIRQLLEFLSDNFFKEEQEIKDVLKQLADYDISAQTVRKIENTFKTGLTLFTHIS